MIMVFPVELLAWKQVRQEIPEDIMLKAQAIKIKIIKALWIISTELLSRATIKRARAVRVDCNRHSRQKTI